MARAVERIEDVLLQIKGLNVPDDIVAAIGQLIRHHAKPAFQPQREIGRSQPRADAPADIGALAREFHKRALRRETLLGGLSIDLAWHMLLALTADDVRGRGVTVSGLCEASGGPATTALRHIQAMEKQGLIERRSDPKDGRRVWVHLTDNTREQMHAMLIDLCMPPPREPPPERGTSVFA